MGFNGRDDKNPQFTDHCFTGDYPTRLVDRDEAEGIVVQAPPKLTGLG